MPVHVAALPPAVPGNLRFLNTRAGRLACYSSAATPSPSAPAAPLLLIHTVNAAASAYEIRPLFEHYAGSRPVFAPDLPGYGNSERRDHDYTPRMMTDAVHAMVDEIRRIYGARPVDALAVSLSAEFLARAAVERPQMFRSIALVSPTGFDAKTPVDGEPGSTRGLSWLRTCFTAPPWSRAFFELLTIRRSIRFFLEKTWGSKQIDEGLLDYNCLTTRQAGAQHAPYDFISGFLFSADIKRVYRALSQPVWMSHGVRGDFVDYHYKSAFAAKGNWTMQVFETGALPYFEVPAQFIAAYDAFLARQGAR